jgi:NAD(P)-dependent dehydrogenase (short-subunit alcohol dehydrogenase family)
VSVLGPKSDRNTISQKVLSIFLRCSFLHAQRAEHLSLLLTSEMFDIRYFGPLYCVKASAPYLSKKGSITSVISSFNQRISLQSDLLTFPFFFGSTSFTIGGLYKNPMKGHALTSSVLGAIVSLAKGLAVDLAPIRTNVVSPGFVDTEVSAYLPDSYVSSSSDS